MADEVVVLQAAKADARKRYAHVNGRRVVPFAGVQVTDVTYLTVSESLGVQTTAGTSRVLYTVATDSCDLRLVFVGWYTNVITSSPNYADVNIPSTVVLKASIESSSVIYPVTFRGSLTGTLEPGGILVTDPFPVDFPRGTLFALRVQTTSTQYRGNRVSFSGGNNGGFSASDLSAQGAGAIASTTGTILAPALVLGTPTDPTARSVVGVGDSIGNGVGDTAGTTSGYGSYATAAPWYGGAGFINRALRGLVGYASATLPGDQAQRFVSFFNSNRRRTFFSQFSDAICEYGRNDISNGRTLAQVQGDLLAIWTLLAHRGVRVWQTTITPYTNSTDGWATTANQSFFGGGAIESVRTAFNDWIRAGAPITSGVPVAVGTGGAITAGQSGHPLNGYFEITDLVETARNSGLWKPATRTLTDASMTTGTATVTSPTGNFTSADLYKGVAVAGAGASGAYLFGVITAVNSTTSIAVSTTATTTVSGVAAGIGVLTADGLHPNSAAAALLSAGVDVTRLTTA